MLHLGVISVLPGMFNSLNFGVTKRALEHNLVRIDCWDLRTWAVNQHGQIDDRPYGGGPGMVMMYEPLHAGITYARAQMPANTRVVYLSPQGKSVKQQDLVNTVTQEVALLFVAGRYEGIDERVI